MNYLKKNIISEYKLCNIIYVVENNPSLCPVQRLIVESA